MRTRVIAWGTGYLGTQGLRYILQRPDMDLVGLKVWSAEKLGRDAGQIAGGDPIGVKATNDCAELLALNADCIVYFSSTVSREREALDEILPFLRAGTNVVSISHFDLQYPAHGNADAVKLALGACKGGGSTVFLTGEEPGFAFGQHLFALLSTLARVERIELVELSMVQNYAGRASLSMYGFNESPEVEPPMFTSQVGAAWHIDTLRGIADHLGLEVSGISQQWEAEPVSFPIDAAAFGTVEPGRTAATRWTVNACVGGRPFITYKKVLRLHPAAGPRFEAAQIGDEPGVTHKIRIDGEPGLSEELFRPKRGVSATPVIAVNAVRAVCDANPGIMTQRDVGHVAPILFKE